MLRASEGTPTPKAASGDARPYPPSWVDRLTDWVGRLPGPPWLFYLALLLFLVGLVNGVRWSTGRQALWTLELLPAYLVVYGVYFLALLHHLDDVAAGAMAEFRVALEVSEEEYRRWRYELTTMPPRHALVTGLAGAALGFFAVLWASPDTVAQYGHGLTDVRLLPVWGIMLFNYAAALTLVYHTVHQLHWVSRIHAAAPRPNLLHSEPLYAFSALTSRTGVGYILYLSFNVALGPEMAEWFNPANLSLIVVGLGIAVVSFVWPLAGMHTRMVQEKHRLLNEVSQRLTAIIAELHSRVDTRALDDAVKLQAMLAALAVERDLLAKIPTWPWPPGTLRGFLSALFLPVAVWLIQQVVERVTGI